ncbi:MAG: TetR/AcrR family transcriptional regulator [Proteobacteria bacterium]|nr:TetR/AcrR family transcriptional regulator [Pseudomonadota bacterium]MDA1023232.1 TetR/AcrR family transcriptional regulator [Pseudomonadota bacterium]
MTSSKRDHLVDTALDLFCRHGFHATGIDKILAQSGVAKMTLYKHFKSKDELILATLHRRDEKFRNDLMRDVERKGKTPRERLLAIFDVLGDWFSGRGFTGCTFINASAEYSAPENPIHAAAAEHNRLVSAYILELAKAAGAKDPNALAQGLMLLVEGAIVMAYVAGQKDASEQAKRTAEILLADAGI